MHAYPGTFANILIVGAFVGILKSTPSADIVDEDCVEVRLPAFNVRNKALESITAINAKSAFTLISVGFYDVDCFGGCILADRVGLNFG